MAKSHMICYSSRLEVKFQLR